MNQDQLDRIEHKLDALLSRLASPVVTYTPTVDDEIAAVLAQGKSLVEYYRDKAKTMRRKKA